LGAAASGLIGCAAALFPAAWMGLFSSDAFVTAVGAAYLVRVGPAYAFLGLGLALYFASQGRGRTAQPLLATLTRGLVSGALRSVALGVFGWGLDALFALMACGLVLYGLVMAWVMRRELGLAAVPEAPGPTAGVCVGGDQPKRRWGMERECRSTVEKL